jgi:hypothetical protein
MSGRIWGAARAKRLLREWRRSTTVVYCVTFVEVGAAQPLVIYVGGQITTLAGERTLLAKNSSLVILPDPLQADSVTVERDEEGMSIRLGLSAVRFWLADYEMGAPKPVVH